MANRDDPVFIIRSQDYNRASIAACIGVLYYDFALTLGSEVCLYWRKEKWSWTRSFFFLNRYTALAAHVPIAFEFFLPDLSEKWFHQLYCVAATLFVTVLLVIRTHALYERSRRILVLLCSIVLCGAIAGCWAIIAGQSYPDIPRINTGVCALPLTIEQGRLFAIAWSTAMLFDTVVFILTLFKRLQIGETPGNSLFYLMIRDGTMYFGFLVVLYSMDLVNFLLATLTNVVASTLISRLMLNIRDTKGSGELTATTNFTPLIFAEANGARSHM